MESTTYSQNLKISPKKLRFLLPGIKKLKPFEALDYLMYTPRKSADIFFKVIKSAINNAKNVLKVDEKTLIFKHLNIEQGRKLKRMKPGGRGTAKPILRRYAHIKIILEAVEPKKEIVTSSQVKTDNSKLKTQKAKPKLKSEKP